MQNRLSGLGRLNYRNVGLGFAAGILMEMQKELVPHCKQYRIVDAAFNAIGEVLKILPDELTEEEVERASQIIKIMEVHILKEGEYSKFLSENEKDEVNELVERLDNGEHPDSVFPNPNLQYQLLSEQEVPALPVRSSVL